MVQGEGSAQNIHLTAELISGRFSIAPSSLGTWIFSKILVAQLLDKRYANAWRETISLRRATPWNELRRPSIFSQLDSYASSHPQPKTLVELVHTTHYSMVDPEGNAVSERCTTLTNSFGSYFTVEGLGFLLNDEMDDFASKPGVPNMFGLIQGPAKCHWPWQAAAVRDGADDRANSGKLFLVLGVRAAPPSS